MDFVTRFKNALFLILVLMAQAIGLAMQVRTPADSSGPDGRSVRLIRMWATSAVTPFERAANAIGYAIHRGWSGYVDLRHVHRQNQDLQQQITRLHIEEAAIAEDALEGHRLQAMLNFRENYVGSTVAAQVIGASGSDQSRVLTIDKGARDGLKPDMAVITQDGVVGKLRDVDSTTAHVLEINDLTSGAGVVLASTRIRAILRGTLTGRVQIGNLTSDSRIKPGEQVFTSGGDQVYPRGLPVGTVESIAPDPNHQPYTAIVVHPAVNLDRVEEVLVITGTQSELPAAAQQDLATAEAQHAADLSVDHLPSIHDGQPSAAPGTVNSAAPDTPGAPAGPVHPVLPHPLPTLHPDRYTSGSSPPAADLIPGAQNAAPSSTPQSDPARSSPKSGRSESPPPAAAHPPAQPESPK